MNVESHVFDGPPRDKYTPALKVTAKRYTTRSSLKDVEGLTLLFTHCIGSHKEQWEPVIERLFETQARRDKGHRIREVWAFDWQNHGDAAVLNREALKSRLEGVCKSEFLAPSSGLSPRMKGHRIVPLGHSAGAAVAIPANELGYPAMVLVEPTMVTREVSNVCHGVCVTATSTRRDTWRSREEAFEYFKKRIPWGFWDARVVRILTEYGLEEKQESMSFPDVEPHFEGVLQLGRICRTLPIHLVWGERNDLVPEFIQDSLDKIKDAGHLVVQEQPDLLAQAIADILDSIGPVTRPRL
ncbi:Alpha/beta hydrolase fold-1 [Flammula alnicola]|nr:Alpha/beta hydrolase fold-1 [Flammula alnicola]